MKTFRNCLSNVLLNKIFLCGILIRLLIIPFFAHPDIFWINAGPSNITDNVLNIYKFHGDDRNIHLFKYPPLAYFALGSQHIIFQPFISDFEYFNEANDIHSYHKWFDAPSVFQNLFFLKLFYLLTDILILFIILALFNEWSKVITTLKTRLIFFWALSPFVFYAVYMYGQFDILPVFFIFLAFYMNKLRKNEYAFLFLGIAGALKHFPFMLAPIFFFMLPAGLLKRFKYIFITVLPYLIFIPFYYKSQSFIEDVFFNSSAYVSRSKIYIIGYLIILVFVFFKQKWISNKNNALIKYSFVVFAWYLICSKEFNPQFIVWIIPFLYLFAAAKNKIGFYCYLFLIPVYFIYITYLGVNSTNKLLLPIDNDLTLLPSINSIISYYLKIDYGTVIKFVKYCFNFILILLFFVKIDTNEN